MLRRMHSKLLPLNILETIRLVASPDGSVFFTVFVGFWSIFVDFTEDSVDFSSNEMLIPFWEDCGESWALGSLSLDI